MAIYFPDGEGGRRVINAGGNTIDITKNLGAVIFRGAILTTETLAQLLQTAGEVGDLWSLAFTDTENGIYAGDLLFCDGTNWVLMKIAQQHFNYSLPTASESVKGGVMIGAHLVMVDGKLNVSFPTASATQKGTIKIGHGLAMSGETLHVTLRGGSGGLDNSYGKIVTIPQVQETLPADMSSLEDWQVINTATYNSQSEEGYWEGDIFIVLPSPFLVGDYNITHIHNVGDYSVIPSQDDYVGTENTGRGYEITTINDSPVLRIPAIDIKWQSAADTQLIIHGDFSAHPEERLDFIAGDGLYFDGIVLNAVPYELPTMSESIKGGAELGNTLVITDNKLNVALGTTPLTLEGSMWLHIPENQGENNNG